MKKILSIFGTRPEAIKLAPVIRELSNNDRKFKSIVCVTAQHREMLDQVLCIFEIKPDYDLAIMKKNQDLFSITSSALMGLKEVIEHEKPDLVLVQGDTTTALVAALGAFYLKIPVGHVEAGLRTHQKYSPFPEEKNRHLLSVLADYHFAPTGWAKSNLLREGILQENIWVTGNTVIDALLSIKGKQEGESARIYWLSYFKEKYNLSLHNNTQKLLLVTGHRRENFGKALENICHALKEIAYRRKDVTIVYPVHPNPNVQSPVRSMIDEQPNIRLTEPLEYEPFVFLMSHSYLILTDSGGIQEEAPSLGKPVLVMRNTTERPEGIAAGTTKLIGTDRESIVKYTTELIDNEFLYERMARATNPYGDGHASEKIVKIIAQALIR